MSIKPDDKGLCCGLFHLLRPQVPRFWRLRPIYDAWVAEVNRNKILSGHGPLQPSDIPDGGMLQRVRLTEYGPIDMPPVEQFIPAFWGAESGLVYGTAPEHKTVSRWQRLQWNLSDLKWWIHDHLFPGCVNADP